MKCIQVVEVGSFNLTRLPRPKPSSDEVLIEVLVTGLCRTDLKLIRAGHRDLVLPRIPGEEVVGTVVEKGAEASSVNRGSLVYVYPGIWCGRCKACTAGAENLCRDMKIMGFHRDGGFAQYVCVPARSVIPVPDNLHPEQAVFAEPLSCCLNALELGRVRQGETVGIWGAGPAGTLLSRAARAMGAEPFSIEPVKWRREKINGYWRCPEQGFDVCIVAVGSKEAYEEAIRRLSPRGRLVLFSGLSKSDQGLLVSFNQVHYLEQMLVGAYGCCHRHGRRALEYLSRGMVAVDDLISHRMPLDDLEKALVLVEEKKCMKIVLYP